MYLGGCAVSPIVESTDMNTPMAEENREKLCMCRIFSAEFRFQREAIDQPLTCDESPFSFTVHRYIMDVCCFCLIWLL